jgi:farnesyl-diphosphate farnesyltransferase
MTATATLPPHTAERAMLEDLLPRVSRTFAMGIRLLPEELSNAVRIAYLLCRIADTIEDEATLPPALRAALLHQFRGWLDGAPHDVAELQRHFDARPGDDAALVRVTPAVLGEYAELPAPVRAAIRAPVEEMCHGMASYVTRTSPQGGVEQPATLAELEQYCWYVAGTVGWMLTDLFRLADTAWSPSRYDRLRALSRGFGLGLQLTNVIRDMGEDHQRGVSFVPADLCAEVDVQPLELFAPDRAGETAAVIGALAVRAHQHLRAGLDYCTTVPRRSLRVRLFCLVPLFLAAGTLRRITRPGAYRQGWVRVKLTRPVVRLTVVLAALVAPSNALIRLAFRQLAPTLPSA